MPAPSPATPNPAIHFPFNPATGDSPPDDYYFSKFQSLADQHPKRISLKDMVEETRGGTYRGMVERIRAEPDKAKRSALKKQLPCYTISGICLGGHKDKDFKKHSGLIVLDYDLADNPQFAKGVGKFIDRVKADQFALVTSQSVSGRGFSVVARIEPDRHRDAFAALSEYFKAEYGIRADKGLHDRVRLRFATFDPNIHQNPDGRVFKRYSLAPAQPAPQQATLHTGPLDSARAQEIASALEFLPSSNRVDWRDVGMAMKLESDTPEMYALFDAWSKSGEGYDEAENRKQWDSFKTDPTQQGITMATIFGRALDSGWTEDPVDPVWTAGALEWGRAALSNIVQPKPNGSIEIIDAADYVENNPPPPNPVLKNFFDVGDKVGIIGKSKSKKTFIATQLALSIAVGRKFLNWDVARPRKVLFVQLEVKPAHFHARVNRVAKGLGIHPDELRGQMLVVNGRGKGLNAAKLLELAKHTGCEVVVLDPVYKLFTGSENDASEWAPLLEAFDQITESGATCIYVMHDKKGAVGEMDATDRGAGSGIVGRDYDAALTITHHGGKDLDDQDRLDLRVLEAVKRNYADEPPVSVRWQPSCTFTLADDVAATMETAHTKNNRSRGESTKRVDHDVVRETALAVMEKREVIEKGDLYEEVGKMFGIKPDSIRKILNVDKLIIDNDQFALCKYSESKRGVTRNVSCVGLRAKINAFEQSKKSANQGVL